MKTKWFAIATIGITALCALETLLWLRSRAPTAQTQLDEFSEGLRRNGV